MTVKELKEKLNAFPDDQEIYVEDDSHRPAEITSIMEYPYIHYGKKVITIDWQYI